MIHANLLFTSCFCLVFAGMSHFGVGNLPRVQRRAEAAKDRGERLSSNQKANLQVASRVRLCKISRTFFGVLGLILLLASFVH